MTDLQVAPSKCVICGEPTESDTHSTCGSKDCDEHIEPYGHVKPLTVIEEFGLGRDY